MKKLFHFEVAALFNDNEEGRSGFIDLLAEGTAVYKTLTLDPSLLQPGTEITISVAECPSCDKPATEHVEGICPCGFNWIEWCRTKYKGYEADASREESDQES